MRTFLPRLLTVLLASLLLAVSTTAQLTVDTLRADLPNVGRKVIVRGTMTVPLPATPFNRTACPYKLVDPFGNQLPTQWELVARMDDQLIVEFLAPYQVLQAGWNEFHVVPGANTVGFARFRGASLALVALQDRVRLVIEDQNGNFTSHSISGAPTWSVDRLGLARITVSHHVLTDFGNWHIWFTLDAHRDQVGVTLNLHNGSLPARPDAFFRSVRLEVPSGWTWASQLPDPITGNGYLINPGQHMLPQRMERAFRVILHPNDRSPLVAEEGWGVGDWSEGGYMAQSNALPILPNAGIDLLPDAIDAFTRLANNQATFPGEQPVGPLWPAKGVNYGGMTGGIEIHQIPGVELAMTGQRAGLLYFFVDQLRYGARHRSTIYQPNGQVISLENYLNPDGSAPWVMFDSKFLGNPAMDQPFGFEGVGPGVGSSSQNPTVFSPIDSQHLVRRLNANRVLAWLANDPLAKLYMRGDAELARMTFFEGPGGRLREPDRLPGLGGAWGRAEAWACEALIHSYAMGDDAYRQRTTLWFERYIEVLKYVQMPNGLFSAVDTGKIAENPPYGNGSMAYFTAHRTNEQIQLVHGMRGIAEVMGLPTLGMIRKAGDGIWKFAWKLGFDGVLDRYPASPVGALRRWAVREQFPAGLTTSVPNDGYHIGTILTYAAEVGSTGSLEAMLAHTNTSTFHDARVQLETWGQQNLANRACMVRFAQRYFP